MNKIEEMIPQIPDEWFDYEPDDGLYGVYDANILLSLHKIADVFDNFCRARMLLLEVDNMSDEGREEDKLYLKSALVLSALMHYATCVDLSYQVVWFRYVEGADSRLITDRKYQEERLQACTRKKIFEELRKKKDDKIHRLYKYINEYSRKKIWDKLRKLNNYYKHNGALHVEGIGVNPRESIIGFGNKSLRILYREEFDIEEWIKILIEFNNDFTNYFNRIIEYVLPDDYKEQHTMDLQYFERLKQYAI